MPGDVGTENMDAGLDASLDSSAGAGADAGDTASEGNSEVQWESLGEEFDSNDAADLEGSLEVDSAPSPAPATLPAQAQPASNAPSQAVEAPPAGLTPPVAPVTAPGQPSQFPSAAPEAVVTPPPAVPQQQAPVQPAFDYTKWRGEQMTQLQAQYKISDDDASGLLTEPELVLPKLLAEQHLRVMENVLTSVQHMVPRVLEQYTAAISREQAAKQQFFAVNSDLADPKFENAIAHFGQTYRQFNQNASPEEAARAVGNLVRAAYGMSGPVPTQMAPPPVQAPVQPFAPMRGGGGGTLPPSGPVNPFAELANEFLLDDRDS